MSMDSKKSRTDLAVRQNQVANMVSQAPAGVRKTLGEAFSGSASPRKAIKAQCLVCVGYDRDAVRNCTGYSCPLWSYRPFQSAIDE